MIEQLKALQLREMITIDHDNVKELTNSEDLTVTQVEFYELDEGQISIVEVDNYTLISYEVADIVRYFFYEILDEGRGRNKYYHNEEFVQQFKIPIEDKKISFVKSEECPLTTEDESILFCQYKSTAYYDSIMIAISNKNWKTYMGFEIDEQQILL